MQKRFAMSMFISKADLEAAKAEYLAKNKATATQAGFSVQPQDGQWQWTGTQPGTGRTGYASEDAAWEAAARAAVAN